MNFATMQLDNNQKAFFVLVKAGLWENCDEFHVSGFQFHSSVDWDEVYRLAEEQSVVGLITAGVEHLKNINIPQELVLQCIGESLQLEQTNKAMNQFIAKLVEKMRKADIYTLLVKGQGIAQCYDRPMWRSSGDVDFYLSSKNYEKAKALLLPKAKDCEDEDKERLHLGMTLDDWVVELHGTMHSKLSQKMDRVADDVHRDIFYNGSVRSWNNNGVQVFLPSADNDVIIVFNHFISHFFLEGVGLRQICDWCRLLWTYRDSLNHGLLEKRVQKMGLVSEWKAFASLAVDYLGMPESAMPFYSRSKKWKKKAVGIISLILESGNFGHAVDKSYKFKESTLIRAILAFYHHTTVALRHFMIFPYTSFLGWTRMMYVGISANLKRK